MAIPTHEDIKDVLGNKFNSEADYMLSTHRGVTEKVREGWKPVGELPDATTDQQGTMVILERRKAG